MTAEDILANAKELTERYAKDITRVAEAGSTIPVLEQIPSRVFVLLQSGTVHAVLSREDKAIDEAHSMMVAYTGRWEAVIPNRYWRSLDSICGVYIEVSAHDVR